MDPDNTKIAAPSILSSRGEGYVNSDRGSTDKRRPVRRDLEKRRQQNIQAQKKYRESLVKILLPVETLHPPWKVSDAQGQERK